MRKRACDPIPGDSVDYEFYGGVREDLLATGRRDHTIQVARLVGDHLAGRNPIVLSFRNALPDPDNTAEPDPTPEARPSLRVQEAVFRALSGRYALKARRLRLKPGRSGVVPSTGTALPDVATITAPLRAPLPKVSLNATTPALISTCSIRHNSAHVAGSNDDPPENRKTQTRQPTKRYRPDE